MTLGALMTVMSGLVGADEIRLAGVRYLGDLPTVVADHEQLFARQGLTSREKGDGGIKL
jgi:hypothetical protein